MIRNQGRFQSSRVVRSMRHYQSGIVAQDKTEYSSILVLM